MGIGQSSVEDAGGSVNVLQPVEFHVVGDALVDVIAAGLPSIPAWGDDANASAIRSSAGGSALNTAVHLASLARPRGCLVSFHGCVGSDGFAHVLRARLREAGVLDQLSALPDEPTGSCIVLSGASERAFVTCAGASGQIAGGHAAGVSAALRRASAPCHVHFGGVYAYGPLRWEIAELVNGWREEAAKSGVRLTVSLDVNGHDAEHVAGLPDALPVLDLFKGTEAEVAAAAACCGGDAALAALVGARPGTGLTVVTTAGAKGAGFKCPSGDGRVEAFEVEVQDTTGAGDACCAGLLFARVAAGMDWREALEFGSAAGAANCMRLGGCSVPVTLEDVEALLSGRRLCAEAEMAGS